MPNNRQWAFLFWIAVLIGWVMAQRDMRSRVWDLVRIARSPKLLVPLAVLVVWVLGLVYAGASFGLWDADRATDTVIWFITAGLVLFGNFGRASSEIHFFRRRVLAALGVSTFVEVLSELFVLSLFAEVILQPVFALFVGISVVAAHRPGHEQVKRLVDRVIVAASGAILLYVVLSLVNNWGAMDKADLAQQFALPVWLTAGVLPYIFVVGLFAAYELAFMRIGWGLKGDWWSRTRLKLALVSSLHVRARDVGSFTGHWQLKLGSATSLREARGVVRAFHQSR